MSTHTEHRDPSPEAMRAVGKIFGRELPLSAIELHAATVDAEYADIRWQNDRLKEALATKAESEKSLFDQLRMREEQLEALLLYGWVAHYEHANGVKEGRWMLQRVENMRVTFKCEMIGPRDQLPPWPESVRQALAEQRKGN